MFRQPGSDVIFRVKRIVYRQWMVSMSPTQLGFDPSSVSLIAGRLLLNNQSRQSTDETQPT